MSRVIWLYNYIDLLKKNEQHTVYKFHEITVLNGRRRKYE